MCVISLHHSRWKTSSVKPRAWLRRRKYRRYQRLHSLPNTPFRVKRFRSAFSSHFATENKSSACLKHVASISALPSRKRRATRGDLRIPEARGIAHWKHAKAVSMFRCNRAASLLSGSNWDNSKSGTRFDFAFFCRRLQTGCVW